MSPWLAPDQVTWAEQRQQVKGQGYPPPFGTFGDTSIKNLGLLMGHTPPWPGRTRGALGPAHGAVGQGLGTRLGMHMSECLGTGFPPAPPLP